MSLYKIKFLIVLMLLISFFTLISCGNHRSLSTVKIDNITPTATPEFLPAFPGVQGWAAYTPGGRGGQIIRVTTLARNGSGSLIEAVQTPGPRIIVFEVGGILDLEQSVINITEPFLTIAGQTAPSPGVTIIRGGIRIMTHDVIIRHLHVRPGSAGNVSGNSWEVDAITTLGAAHDVIIDHCSLSWATDENLTASGPRFDGSDFTQWRQHTSHRITFSNNIIAEGLSHSSHQKGEHSKGTLVHDNVTEILIINNLYVSNMERNPLFKGGAKGAVINNYIYNPGRCAMHYNLLSEEWRPHRYQSGQMTLIGNVLRAGPATNAKLAFLMMGGSGDLELYSRDNIAVDRIGNPLPQLGRYTTTLAGIIPITSIPVLPAGVNPIPAVALQDSLLRNVGARPWDRDLVDRRLVSDVVEGKGSIIDSELEVGGYPNYSATYQPFNPEDWDLNFMVPRNRLIIDPN